MVRTTVAGLCDDFVMCVNRSGAEKVTGVLSVLVERLCAGCAYTYVIQLKDSDALTPSSCS
ncbi:uncharacterized protein SETTUDRAFT_169052 [Exserohilum turcica Et28A]|uniref:Uncharacterized protein n=1 Tax=Exserohilum turcicum (strain 28A) TaxID=671987 RepID=R0K3J4_EXST2|nr:uncharacterized protein SETTUDRAFT_169052 [Exserohilum turcica Et28A]EOA87638.1 hypothetical protein SETTUDRAFT_169052 [Exserohilum turcica Et28A]